MLYLGPNPLSSLNFRSSKTLVFLFYVVGIDVLGLFSLGFCLLSISLSSRSSKSSSILLLFAGNGVGFCNTGVAVTGLSYFFANFLN
jgi:hypothetical protein